MMIKKTPLTPTIPVKYITGGHKEAELKAMGFKLGEKVKGDTLHRYVELPPGWEKTSSYIMDENGIKRISFYYYQDSFKDAYFAICPRIRLTSDYGFRQGTDTRYVISEANNKHNFLFVTHFTYRQDFPDDAAYTKAENRSHASATTWVKKHFPDYMNPIAYWDAEGDEIIKKERMRK